MGREDNKLFRRGGEREGERAVELEEEEAELRRESVSSDSTLTTTTTEQFLVPTTTATNTKRTTGKFPTSPKLNGEGGTSHHYNSSTGDSFTPTYPTSPPIHLSPQLPYPPTLVSAVYSEIPVWELTVNGVQVMRRCKDSYLNCTQLLKVANVDKGKRTKILEKEVYPELHEKVQGGYGKYQGTWIPFEKGCQFARKHGVEELIKPLLDLNPATSSSVPIKASAKSSSLGRRAGSASMPMFDPPWATPGLPRTQSAQLPLLKLPPLEPAPPKRLLPKALTTPRKRVARPPTNPTELDYDHNHVATPQDYPPGGSLCRRQRLMEAFIDEHAGDTPLPLTALKVGPGELDLPLDSQGYTALHWAAAFGRATALTQLIAHGADPNRPTPSGLTPLMRTVLHTHSRRKGTFESILHSLSSSLECQDGLGRTVFHHLVVGADQPELLESAQYYLLILARYLRLKSCPLPALLNLADSQGDTPCHLASRLGLVSLLDELSNLGADLSLMNHSHLSPSDYLLIRSPRPTPPVETGHHPVLPPIEAPPSRVNEVTSAIRTIVTDIERQFHARLDNQHREILRLRQQLDDAHRRLLTLESRPPPPSP